MYDVYDVYDGYTHFITNKTPGESGGKVYEKDASIVMYVVFVVVN